MAVTFLQLLPGIKHQRAIRTDVVRSQSRGHRGPLSGLECFAGGIGHLGQREKQHLHARQIEVAVRHQPGGQPIVVDLG